MAIKRYVSEDDKAIRIARLAEAREKRKQDRDGAIAARKAKKESERKAELAERKAKRYAAWEERNAASIAAGTGPVRKDREFLTKEEVAAVVKSHRDKVNAERLAQGLPIIEEFTPEVIKRLKARKAKKKYKGAKPPKNQNELLVKKLAAVTDTPPAEARFWMSAVCGLIQHQILTGEPLNVPGVGIIYTIDREDRIRFHHQRLEDVLVKGGKFVKMQPDPELMNRIRAKFVEIVELKPGDLGERGTATFAEEQVDVSELV